MFRKVILKNKMVSYKGERYLVDVKRSFQRNVDFDKKHKYKYYSFIINVYKYNHNLKKISNPLTYLMYRIIDKNLFTKIGHFESNPSSYYSFVNDIPSLLKLAFKEKEIEESNNINNNEELIIN